MKLTFIKTQTGLIPECEETREILNKVKNGDGIILDYKPKRNYLFHKKLTLKFGTKTGWSNDEKTKDLFNKNRLQIGLNPLTD